MTKQDFIAYLSQNGARCTTGNSFRLFDCGFHLRERSVRVSPLDADPIVAWYCGLRLLDGLLWVSARNGERVLVLSSETSKENSFSSSLTETPSCDILTL